MRFPKFVAVGLLAVAVLAVATQLVAAPIAPLVVPQGSVDAKILVLQNKINQLVTEHNRNRTIQGNVFGTGAIASGTEFTAVRNGPGSYTITFNQPFTTFPAISVTPDDQVGLRVDWSISPASFTVNFLDGANVATDSLFSFMVMGPS